MDIRQGAGSFHPIKSEISFFPTAALTFSQSKRRLYSKFGLKILNIRKSQGRWKKTFIVRAVGKIQLKRRKSRRKREERARAKSVWKST